MVTGNIRTTLHGSQLRGARLSLAERAALAQRFGYDGLDFSLAEARGLGDPATVQALLADHQLLASTVGGVLTAPFTDDEATFTTALAAVSANAREAAALGASRSGAGLPFR
ncbi:MAG TPA: hypothetical protein VGP33_04600, partial [Chloroflexota bacterium]|nr:hypothetical protein [Chloroflexota bacterium]